MVCFGAAKFTATLPAALAGAIPIIRVVTIIERIATRIILIFIVNISLLPILKNRD
jgi:hypothetical protein